MNHIKQNLESYFFWGGVALLVIITWVAWPFIVELKHKPTENAGEFGDLYGGLNTLFTGLAFVGVAYTLIIQRHQLYDARNEIKKNTETREIERFENVFFSLLENHRQLVLSLELELDFTWSLRNEEACWKGIGRNAIEAFNYAILAHIKIKPRDSWRDWNSTTFAEKFEVIYKASEACMAHYFRSLYQITKFINKCPDDSKRIFYAKVFRAQLSSEEVFALFMNGLFPRGHRFKKLIEKYGLLEHFPAWAIAFKNSGFYVEYNDSAFSDPENDEPDEL